MVNPRSASAAASTDLPHVRYTSSMVSSGNAAPNMAKSVAVSAFASGENCRTSSCVPAEAALRTSLTGVSRSVNAGSFPCEVDVVSAAASLRSRP